MNIVGLPIPDMQLHRPDFIKPLRPLPKDNPVDPANHLDVQDRALHRMGQENRRRILGSLLTATRKGVQLPEMRDLAERMLVAPVAGEAPQPDEAAWDVVCRFDEMHRSGQQNGAALLGDETFQRVRQAAADPAHPCHADACLLSDIMTRPAGSDAPSLQDYLSGVVDKQVKAMTDDNAVYGRNFDLSPRPDFSTREGCITFVRTWNGVLTGLSLHAQDYASPLARTMLLKGTLPLLEAMGEPKELSAPDQARTADKAGAMDAPEPGSANQKLEPLADRLKKAVFCFPALPAENTEKLTLQDFNTDFDMETMEMEPNPLEKKFGREFTAETESYWR
jgi:hypothetical protein